jgi:transposase
MNKTIDLLDYFKNPETQRQKQYEAVRAVIVENESTESVAKKFNYKQSTIYSLIRDAKAGKLELFPTVPKGPKQKRTSTIIQNKIIDYRRDGLSTFDIQERLWSEQIRISINTIDRILKDSGFKKLKRRTNKERGVTSKKKVLPEPPKS